MYMRGRWTVSLLALAALALIPTVAPGRAEAAFCGGGLTGANYSAGWMLDGSEAVFADAVMVLRTGRDVVRTDAFDDYLNVEIDGTYYNNPTSRGCSFRKLRKAGTEVVFPAREVVAGVTARPRLFASRGKSFARLLVTLRNTDNAPKTVSFAWDGDLGSDSSTRVHTTSSGDTAMTVADRWAVSCEDWADNGCGTVSGDEFGHDPEIAHNWERKGKKKHSADTVLDVQAFGGSVRFQYDNVTIGAGKSIAFMHVVSLAPTAKRAVRLARAIDRNPAKVGVYAGISKRERKKLQNW